MIELLILFLLFTKHFIVDFPLQTPYQYLNKGKYGHAGGLLHSALHGLATFIIFAIFLVSIKLALFLAIIDFVVHYHIDWAKVNINNRYGWKSDKHSQFWILLGLDQYLHALTYIGLVFFL
jgi:Protein of unknown function (DUF3307)